jgi:alkylated DNA repair dioxygenase AlkB
MTTLLSSNNSRLIVYKNFYNGNYDFLYNLPLIERPEIVVYGKTCRQNRDVGFFAEPHVPGYKYSGQQTTVININDYQQLVTLLNHVNTELNTDFNGILINRYRDGSNYISAHSDDERGLSNVGVATICIGATRLFRIREKTTKKMVIDVDHNHSDMILMSGEFQKHYTHEVPIQKKINETRISLTFRKHKI